MIYPFTGQTDKGVFSCAIVMNAKKNVPNFTDKGNGGILWKVFPPKVLEVRYENGTGRKISMGQRSSKKGSDRYGQRIQNSSLFQEQLTASQSQKWPNL